MRLVGTADDGDQFYFAWGCFRNFVLLRLRVAAIRRHPHWRCYPAYQSLATRRPGTIHDPNPDQTNLARPPGVSSGGSIPSARSLLCHAGAAEVALPFAGALIQRVFGILLAEQGLCIAQSISILGASAQLYLQWTFLDFPVHTT